MKILFTSTHLTSFIKKDLEFLQKHFEVEPLTTNGIGAAFSISSSIKHVDVTFTWFASVYSSLVVFFAKRKGKKSIIVIGGVDVAKHPEINYGVWLSWWKAILVKYAIRNAYKVLAVDPFQQKEAIRLADYDGDNIEYVPTGYDASKWFPSGSKEVLVLTVAGCETEERLKVKGLDVLVESARLLPNIQFVIIGVTNIAAEILRRLAPANVEILPFIEPRELLRYYQKAKVYCQPSYVEGLPNSLCEAMLCECVPVGSNVGGVPTAIREIGFLVPRGDVEMLSGAIRKALQSPENVSKSARKHIAETFPLQRREEALLRIIRGATS